MAINSVSIPYNDFKLMDVIDPEQFDENNRVVVNKLNEVIQKMVEFDGNFQGTWKGIALENVGDGVTAGRVTKIEQTISTYPARLTQLEKETTLLYKEVAGLKIRQQMIYRLPDSDIIGTLGNNNTALGISIDLTQTRLKSVLNQYDTVLQPESMDGLFVGYEYDLYDDISRTKVKITERNESAGTVRVAAEVGDDFKVGAILARSTINNHKIDSFASTGFIEHGYNCPSFASEISTQSGFTTLMPTANGGVLMENGYAYTLSARSDGSLIVRKTSTHTSPLAVTDVYVRRYTGITQVQEAGLLQLADNILALYFMEHETLHIVAFNTLTGDFFDTSVFVSLERSTSATIPYIRATSRKDSNIGHILVGNTYVRFAVQPDLSVRWELQSNAIPANSYPISTMYATKNKLVFLYGNGVSVQLYHRSTYGDMTEVWVAKNNISSHSYQIYDIHAIADSNDKVYYSVVNSQYWPYYNYSTTDEVTFATAVQNSGSSYRCQVVERETDVLICHVYGDNISMFPLNKATNTLGTTIVHNYAIIYGSTGYRYNTMTGFLAINPYGNLKSGNPMFYHPSGANATNLYIMQDEPSVLFKRRKPLLKDTIRFTLSMVKSLTLYVQTDPNVTVRGFADDMEMSWTENDLRTETMLDLLLAIQRANVAVRIEITRPNDTAKVKSILGGKSST